MIYFENAHVEFFGTPMAYFPFLSTPDPTVKRKSGFLYPVTLYSSIYGAGIQVPYYWALAPDYDLTITPRIMSRQGLLMKGEWRQRLDNGYYTFALSGIYQLDKDYFLEKYHTTDYPSYRDWRGSIETRGRFAITDKWDWGWDGLLPTDSLYYSDYGLRSYQRSSTFALSGFTEGLNQVYITGRGNRSYFDARSIYYYGFSVADVQSQIPIIHPVVDYFYTVDQPVLGGELGFRTNLTSLSRNTASFDPISQFANRHRRLRTGQRRPDGQDPGQLPAARHSGQLQPLLRRGELEAHLYGHDRPAVDAVRVAAWRRDVDVDREPDRRLELHRARRPGRSPSDAGRRPRIPLSVHQRAILGHADHHADRPDRRAPERDLDRPVAQRRLAEPDLRRQQSFQDQQVQRLGSHRGRRPRQRRPGVHGPVQSRAAS